MPRTEFSESLPYRFDQQEIVDMAKEMAKVRRDKALLETEAKGVAETYKGKITVLDGRGATLANLITQGFDYKLIPCCYEMNMPEEGKKTTIRMDTFEIVRVEDMSPADKQMVLDLDSQ